MKRLPGYRDITMGADPEFFFSNKGVIIGSEKIIPKDGLGNRDAYNNPLPPRVVRDGIQAEINPEPRACRQQLGSEIARCLHEAFVKTKESKVKLDFRQLIKVDKKEFDSLSPESKVFGCTPSYNIYTKEASKIGVNPLTYLYRSAGGHIHLGNIGEEMKATLKDVDKLIPMLDIILGNTCVLIDRDPGNIERRKVYGKAGEFRDTSYGAEYRVLSNFWLIDYKLMGFVMGMARFAVMILLHSTKTDNYEKLILDSVNEKDIQKAINDNDFNLAMKNFRKIMPIIIKMNDRLYPLNQNNMREFLYFVEKGIDYWFNKDPIIGWNDRLLHGQRGWESFLEHTVRKEMKIMSFFRNIKKFALLHLLSGFIFKFI